MSYKTEIAYRYCIKPKSLEISVKDVERQYGDENPIYTIEYSGFVNSDNENSLIEKPYIETFANKYSTVGVYKIEPKGAVSPNYNITYKSGLMTINKAPLSIKVNDVERVYGANNPKFSCQYIGLKNEESEPEWDSIPKYVTLATKISDVGVYSISKECGVAKNYEIIENNEGLLVINKAPLTIIADNKNRKYFEENPELTYTCVGFVNDDTRASFIKNPVLYCGAELNSPAGKYTIVVSEADAKNYSITYNDAILEVLKRTLTVIPSDVTRKYGESNPIFEATYDGFVNNENESNLEIIPTIKSNATQMSNAGTYNILAEGGVAENYKFAYLKGILTITKAAQTIEWEQDFGEVKVGDQVELLAKTTSGLKIQYVCDSDIATIYNVGDKQYIDCLKPGVLIIRAMQEGNVNYETAVRVSKTMTIIDGSGGVDDVCIDKNESIECIYDIHGRVLEKLPKGIAIVKLKNGIIKKVYTK